MGGLWRDKLRNITPYVPGEQPKGEDIIKLNANENPYPPSPKVKKAIADFDADTLRLYPDANAGRLKKALSVRYRVKEDQIFLGNGSDDVLALSFQSFFTSQKPVFFPDITYSFYPVWCDLFHIPYQTQPLTEDFNIQPRDYDAENGGVILPNPNAPTGISEGRQWVEDIVSHNQDAVVIIDEAYVDFGGYSSVELINRYENLLVVHTFSKSRSLPGMRIGVAFGSPCLIQVLEAVKNSYNSYTLNSLSIAAGAAAVEDEEYFQKTLAKIKLTRQMTADALKKLGFCVCPSQANFLFVTHPHIKAKELFSYLKQKGIYVRHFDKPRIANYLRITIGTEEQMQKLLDAVKEYLEKA